jgi:hypothetical protein
MMDQNEQFDVGVVLNNPDVPRIIRDEIDREILEDLRECRDRDNTRMIDRK